MKVVICGAGIAGLALANRVAALGGEVVVLERAAGPRQQGYMIDFFGAGYDAADAIGVLPAIEATAYHVEEAALVDDRGRRRAGVDYRQFAAAVNGRLLDVMRPDLERVLRENLPSQVDLRFGAGVAAVDDRGDGVRVTLTDGATVDADLLVGADGIHSTVRRLVFGPEEQFIRYLGFHTAAWVFDSPGIHAMVRDRFCLTDTIDKQMGFYGLRDGKVAAFAVHRDPDPAVPHDIRAAVLETYGSLGWRVPEALEHCPPADEIYYDQVAQVEVPRWHHGRVVLLGDAAYAVSLLAGQGASLAIAGAYVLAEQLSRAPSIPEALLRYEQLWRPVAAEKQRVGRSGVRWFLPARTSQLIVRRVAMRAARLPALGRLLGSAIAGKPAAVIGQLARS